MEVRLGKCLCGGPERVIEENGHQIIERCPLYIKVHGQHPQTGELVDEWRCAIAWLPLLLIEGAQQTRQAGAAVESLRNEIVRRVDQTRLDRANEMLELCDAQSEQQE